MGHPHHPTSDQHHPSGADAAAPPISKGPEPDPLQQWLTAAALTQPASSATSVAALHQNQQESKHSLRQFVLTIVLISIYTLGNAALMVQWFLGHAEAPIAVAAVGNIGVFVGAAVAYYFASRK